MIRNSPMSVFAMSRTRSRRVSTWPRLRVRSNTVLSRESCRASAWFWVLRTASARRQASRGALMERSRGTASGRASARRTRWP
ncbi:MAG TPA: hypothetical protein DHV93_01170 [Holophagaceae bacterium]|nr:hypothetical protein [Holophagaceae bacterium]